MHSKMPGFTSRAHNDPMPERVGPATEPPWMTQARGMIGLREIAGPQHASAIVRMWDRIHTVWIRDDETPWCAAFVGTCLEDAGFRSTRRANARSYETWGRPYVPPAGLSRHAKTGLLPECQPPYGTVAVLERLPRPTDGHVCFYVGPATPGTFYALGGNQGNAVSVRQFPYSRVVAWRWPKDYPVSYFQPPVSYIAAIRADAGQSESEA